jgi:hypothetical protein
MGLQKSLGFVWVQEYWSANVQWEELKRKLVYYQLNSFRSALIPLQYTFIKKILTVIKELTHFASPNNNQRNSLAGLAWVLKLFVLGKKKRP